MTLRLYLLLLSWGRRCRILWRLIWLVRRGYWKLERSLLLPGRLLVDAGPLLHAGILAAEPLAAGKMGLCELRGLRQGLRRAAEREQGKRPRPYGAYVAEGLSVMAGLFPRDAEVFDRFAGIYLTAVRGCDLLALWDVAGEARIVRRYCQHSHLVVFKSLEPFFSSQPWTEALRGKRVLVLSPFSASITAQYARRALLWADPRVLPDFELLTVTVPFSAALVESPFSDWFAALEALKAEMDRLDYDVALVGAGAYSLPLVLHAKERGKCGVHMGGALQFLFGIYGRRWENEPEYQSMINGNWVRPSQAETPSTHHRIENGCYW